MNEKVRDSWSKQDDRIQLKGRAVALAYVALSECFPSGNTVFLGSFICDPVSHLQ